jgi:hypothetical protein
MKSDAKTIDELRREVLHLKDELSMARHGILEMLPQHLQKLLASPDCEDIGQLVD